MLPARLSFFPDVIADGKGEIPTAGTFAATSRDTTYKTQSQFIPRYESEKCLLIHYLMVQFGDSTACVGEAKRPVRVRVALANQILLRLKVAKAARTVQHG